MGQGAQAQWMSKQGTHAAEHALLTALSRGFVDAAEVILEYSKDLPAPRGQSLFAIALGAQDEPNHPDDYKRMVQALLAHGYTFEDQEKVARTALAEVFQRNLDTHAAILLEAGAGKLFEDQGFTRDVLKSSMCSLKGVEVLTRYCPLEKTPSLLENWWRCASEASRGVSNMESLVRIGLESALVSDELAFSLLKNATPIMAEMLRQGFELPAFHPLEAWETVADEQPAWRHNPGNLNEILVAGVPAKSLNLQAPESRLGLNWLSYMVVEEGVVDIQSWRPNESRATLVASMLPHAIHAGLDIHARDDEGFTAGHRIVDALMKNKSSDDGSRLNTQAWLDLVADFGLLTTPALVEGVEVPLDKVNGGRTAIFLSGRGYLARVLAQIDHHELSQGAPAASQMSSSRRRI